MLLLCPSPHHHHHQPTHSAFHMRQTHAVIDRKHARRFHASYDMWRWLFYFSYIFIMKAIAWQKVFWSSWTWGLRTNTICTMKDDEPMMGQYILWGLEIYALKSVQFLNGKMTASNHKQSESEREIKTEWVMECERMNTYLPTRFSHRNQNEARLLLTFPIWRCKRQTLKM